MILLSAIFLQFQKLKKPIIYLQVFYDKKMFNLNNCSNTDIKMEYGAANLAIMSEYDDNFIAMCKAAVKLANALEKME